MSKPEMLSQAKDIGFPAPIMGVTSNTQETFLLTDPFPETLPVSSPLQASLTVRAEPSILTKSQSLPLNFPCRSNNSDPQFGSLWQSGSFVLEMVTPGCEVSSQPLLCQEHFPGSSHPLESCSLQNPLCSVWQPRSRLIQEHSFDCDLVGRNHNHNCNSSLPFLL